MLEEQLESLETLETAAESLAPVSELSSELATEAITEVVDESEDETREFIPTAQVQSIVESLLFASDRPLSLATLKEVFKKTNVNIGLIKKTLETLEVEYASAQRGVTLEQVNGGYQLRTKIDNMIYLKRMVKMRPFRLSGPALEVMSIVAYKQPIIKAEVDQIRGVESGHLMRALMEKGLVTFAGKSDLPGRPALYGTTRKFLETFSLRGLKELPSLSEIDELLPEGIGEEPEQEQSLGELTDSLSQQTLESYSQGEGELLKISDEIAGIQTSSDFFEQEKQRQKAKREAEKARDIQEAIVVGEEVSERDRNWLERYLVAQSPLPVVAEEAVTEAVVETAAELN